MNLSRRRLLFAAPAVILTPGLLMKIKPSRPDLLMLLEKTSEVLNGMHWSNGYEGHWGRVVVRVGMPSVTWRRLYDGITPHRSSVIQVDYTIEPGETREQAIARAVKAVKV